METVSFYKKWDDNLNCPFCGQPIDKLPPNTKIEQVLKDAEIDLVCCKCKSDANLQLLVNRTLKNIQWPAIFELWDIGIDVFPAIEVKAMFTEAENVTA